MGEDRAPNEGSNRCRYGRIDSLESGRIDGDLGDVALACRIDGVEAVGKGRLRGPACLRGLIRPDLKQSRELAAC